MSPVGTGDGRSSRSGCCSCTNDTTCCVTRGTTRHSAPSPAHSNPINIHSVPGKHYCPPPTRRTDRPELSQQRRSVPVVAHNVPPPCRTPSRPASGPGADAVAAHPEEVATTPRPWSRLVEAGMGPGTQGLRTTSLHWTVPRDWKPRSGTDTDETRVGEDRDKSPGIRGGTVRLPEVPRWTPGTGPSFFLPGFQDLRS